MSKWKFQWYKPRTVAFTKCRLRDEPKDAADLEWPLSEGMQVSTLPPVWIAMIISSWSVKLLKLPSVTFVAQTVTIGEQKVCPESESMKFSTTLTPQVENPSDSSTLTPTPQPWFACNKFASSSIISRFQTTLTTILFNSWGSFQVSLQVSAWTQGSRLGADVTKQACNSLNG